MARKKPANKTKLPAKTELAPVPKGALPQGYAALLPDLKERVRAAQLKAALSVNRELIQLYWDIGRKIVERQELEGWGGGVINRLAHDLQNAFPGMQGFSPSNVSRMRAFYSAYTRELQESAQAVPKSRGPKSAQAVPKLVDDAPPAPMAEIPWGHNIALLFKLSDPAERLWYAHQTLQHGWSRTILTVQIESGLYQRQGKAVTNFAATLPPPQSDLAQQTLKDPYLFDFLTLADDARELDLERELLNHVEKFLLELGIGFAFVGRQVTFTVADVEFTIDLLFYHLRLRSFFVIDLKTVDFKPEFAGKMNFYLSTVDDQMRHADDKPSIGLILCKSHNRVVAEYALRDVNKPIGVAEWQTRLVKSLPEHLKGSLPTIAELEAELARTKNNQ